MPGDQKFLMLSSIVFAKSTSFWPPTTWDTDSISPFMRSRIRTVMGLAMMEPRYLLMAPTLGAIDMPLSFSTMMMSRPEWPALFIASYGSTQVRGASPTPGTTLNCPRLRARAEALPNAHVRPVPPRHEPNVYLGLPYVAVNP